jgi:hypothetical protein
MMALLFVGARHTIGIKWLWKKMQKHRLRTILGYPAKSGRSAT